MAPTTVILPGESLEYNNWIIILRPPLFIFTIGFTEGYGFIVMAAGAIGLIQLGLGGSVMKLRKVFGSVEYQRNPEVTIQQVEHQQSFCTPVDELGYPDMGEGKYAKNLTYHQWVDFNSAQRGHYNMVEHSGPILTAMILNGFFQPKLSATLGAAYAVGRLLYTFGRTAGTNRDNRCLGAVFSCGISATLGALLAYNGLDRLLCTGVIRVK